MTLKRKRTKKRRTTSPRCSKQRCERPASIAGMCKTHATKEADRVFSLVVRGYGDCYGNTDFWKGSVFKCAGRLQCAHLISRRYRNIRWNHKNAVPLCMGHHRWLDTHPIERDNMIREWMGDESYEKLRRDAIDDSIDWRIVMLDFLLPSSRAGEDT